MIVEVEVRDVPTPAAARLKAETDTGGRVVNWRAVRARQWIVTVELPDEEVEG
jgi:hypothetical protein